LDCESAMEEAQVIVVAILAAGRGVLTFDEVVTSVEVGFTESVALDDSLAKDQESDSDTTTALVLVAIFWFEESGPMF
jgi:hypothetical protein